MNRGHGAGLFLHSPTRALIARFPIYEVNKPRGAEVERLKPFYHNMKRTFLALTMLALVLPALPQARGQAVSVDFFYNNLSGGNWIEAADYGYGWQPDVATSDPNWRPYADGYWAYTDDGWTWVSYEDFGWATYHYGRWARLADQGWVWFPGSDLDWGPAWVSWRTGGDYVGWAPLPPRGPGVVYEGQPIGARVDIDFDIGPDYYNFIDARFIGEPVLRDRIFAPSQNVNYINNTVNVTNITVQNNVVYNYGPDYDLLSSRSSRPIQRLKIERQQNVDLSTAAKSGALTKVQGDKLFVGAPTKISKSAPSVAPPKIKTKVAQPKIVNGWAGVANAAQLKEKMKTENPKNVLPPTGAPATGRATGAASPVLGASPTVTAAPAGSPAPFERGRGKGKPGKAGGPPELGVTATPTVSPVGSPAPFERGKGRGRPSAGAQPGFTGSPTESPSGAASPTPFEKGKGRGRPGAGAQPAFTGSPTESPSGAASPAPFEKGKGRGRPGAGAQPGFTPPAQSPSGLETTPPPGKHKGQFERGFASPSPAQSGGTSNMPAQGRQKGRGPEQTGTPPVTGAAPYEGRGRGRAAEQTGTPPATGVAPEGPGGRQRSQGAYGQPGSAPGGGTPAGPERGQGKPEGGKKKGQKPSPSPAGPPPG